VKINVKDYKLENELVGKLLIIKVEYEVVLKLLY